MYRDRDVVSSYGKPPVPIRLMRIGICAKLAETLATNNYYKQCIICVISLQELFYKIVNFLYAVSQTAERSFPAFLDPSSAFEL